MILCVEPDERAQTIGAALLAARVALPEGERLHVAVLATDHFA